MRLNPGCAQIYMKTGAPTRRKRYAAFEVVGPNFVAWNDWSASESQKHERLQLRSAINPDDIASNPLCVNRSEERDDGGRCRRAEPAS